MENEAKRGFGLPARAAKPSETQAVHGGGHANTNVAHCCFNFNSCPETKKYRKKVISKSVSLARPDT